MKHHNNDDSYFLDRSMDSLGVRVSHSSIVHQSLNFVRALNPEPVSIERQVKKSPMRDSNTLST